eukprot:CAMPEP_0183709482 /NCGR_PEP_ID=MMETSP0737-20130205/5531_1 /TAXON_ID=385413 /ORGANISM="Thalassiosira miniscula, Strain CCMP1093" /LENGTH=87 /DNA_ID=CAMNT_0025937605 /DNA_START=110 /DNA_END=373 /DNA_ORIENTATION=-
MANHTNTMVYGHEASPSSKNLIHTTGTKVPATATNEFHPNGNFIPYPFNADIPAKKLSRASPTGPSTPPSLRSSTQYSDSFFAFASM